MNSNQNHTFSKLKTSYKAYRSWIPIHTGGEAAISNSSQLLFTTLDEEVILSHLESGSRLFTFEGDSSIVTSLSCTPSKSNPKILIAYRSLCIKLYSLQGESTSDPDSIKIHLIKSIGKAHEAPISISTPDPTSSVFATGDTAGVVRLWDVEAGHCTHVFKGHQLISALAFDVCPTSTRTRLAVGSGDGRIKLWDLRSHALLGVFDHGHVSVIRGLAITKDGSQMISGSRDQVVNVWDLSLNSTQTGKIIKTIPVYETLESIGLVYPSPDVDEDQPPGPRHKGKSKAKSSTTTSGLAFYTAGDKGVVRLWDLTSGEQIAIEQGKEITSATTLPHASIFDTRFDEASNTLLVNKVDQTFSLLSLPSLTLLRQIVGNHDEIIDTAALHHPTDGPSTTSATHLALATNSPLIRIVSLGVGANETDLLAGHEDVVLCLGKSQDRTWFVSGSKDKTARVWRRDGDGRWVCVGICEGHVQALGAISVCEFDEGSPARRIVLLATASQDRTVKLWDLSHLSKSTTKTDSNERLRSVLTLKVHEKDINAIDFSIDGKLFASGSQDKLCKVFGVSYSTSQGSSLTLEAILKGHSRGIWCVRFSKTDKLLSTGSSDGSIKLWSVDRGSGMGTCVKTFEGHSNAVLRVEFMNFGHQLVSTSADGLVKVWEIKSQVCVSTLGEEEEEDDDAFGPVMRTGGKGHDGKIWALEVEEDGHWFISAGGDGKVICWEDRTLVEEEERVKVLEEEARLGQDVENYIRLKDYRTVLFLLIRLEKPVKLLRLFKELEEQEDEKESMTGSVKVDEAIADLKALELLKLLEYVRDWNALGRTTEVAQRVLYTILKFHSYDNLIRGVGEEEEEKEEMDQEKKNQPKKIKKKNGQMKMKEILDGLLPYTERHLNRLEKLNQEICVVQYVLNQMGGGLCEF